MAGKTIVNLSMELPLQASSNVGKPQCMLGKSTGFSGGVNHRYQILRNKSVVCWTCRLSSRDLWFPTGLYVAIRISPSKKELVDRG